ncbi:MAG: PaaI family thioesterase [Pseudomonadota bacterium]
MIEPVRKLKAEGRFGEVNQLIPYAQMVGLEVDVVDGKARTVLRSQPSNIGNPVIPAVHGGLVGAALEHASIIEVLYTLEPEHLPRVINVTISYMRPVLDADMFMHTEIVRHGRRIANVHAYGWQDDPSRWVASAQINFKLAD